MKRFLIALIALLAAGSIWAQTLPKREFRGIWIPTVGDKYYMNHTTEENKAYLLNMLDSAQAVGCNAIIFHCRPQADAFYPSKLEPWSYWIAGKAGKGPDTFWDPMEFMVKESHKRGMELHAWINPYRVGFDYQFCDSSFARKHPEWFVRYNNQTYFDPAYPECRDFINSVVADIVTRYDIDALHMDDFFYPYPKKNLEFQDTTSYAMYGNGQDRGDWRRHNVDLLIESMNKTIKDIKPWVRYGISPFGIWRNKRTDPEGSETTGLQCYDVLYADCLKWTKEGWVDYLVPQLYWQMEFKAASDSILMDWWNKHTNGRDMYYGYDAENTMNYRNTNDTTINNQLSQKLDKERGLSNVSGHVWWPCYVINSNYKGVADSLIHTQQKSLALPPRYTWLDNKAPKGVENLHTIGSVDGKKVLIWKAPMTNDRMQKAGFFVVYRFAKGEKVNLDNASAIVRITFDNAIAIEGNKGEQYTYVVTALDRCNNESKGKKIKVKF